MLPLWVHAVSSSVVDRQLLTYAPTPNGAYTPPVDNDTVTLLDLVKSRSDLTNLTKILEQAAGETFAQLNLILLRCPNKRS